jgi:hypothetical protein
MKYDDFVVVYTTMGLLRAEVIKGKLESAGIHAFLKYESAGTMLPVLADGLGQVQVLVAREHETEARELLEEKSEGQD